MAESADSQDLPSTSTQSFHEKISLETHTWYKERFRMIDKWRHEIPYYLITSSLSESYTAITNDCLLQDISYYTCIEIVGEKNLLKATLKKHCNPKETFAAKMYTNGQKEGTLMFFKKNGYPQFPIGNVNFFWKLGKTKIKTIWIWVHPAFYNDFLNEIISSFEFEQNNAEQDRTDISHNLSDLYTNDAGCEMRVLKYELNRFRLSGPAALTVLKEVLYVPSVTELNLDLENMDEEQDSSLSDEKLDTSTDCNVSVQPVEKMVIDENEKDTKDLTIHDLKDKMWHFKYYKERGNIEAFKIQDLMWQLMKVLGAPRFLPSNMIIGLTVLDPRFYLEVKKTRPEIPSSAENLRSQLPADLNRSPIWNSQIRHIVSNSCVSTDRVNQPRSESLVLGRSDDPYFNKDALARIPILLIQKPAVASLDLGSGIDIIIPLKWAMVFWSRLLKHSPFVGGLREIELAVFETLGTYAPDFIDPDTPAYMREALARKEELTDAYFSRSPNQRVNFIEFGICSPFFCDWKNLTKGWSAVEDFYVLRDFRLLALLETEIQTIERENAGFISTVQESKFDFHEFDEYKNCLVRVKLFMVDKGTPKEFAIICTPTLEDLGRFENEKMYEGPVEKIHNDPYENYRNTLRRSHIMELEQVSRRGVKRKKTFEDDVLPGEFDVIHDEINDAELSKRDKMISDHAKEMRKWYLPESTDVRHSCDREVMGYVTMGGQSFLRSNDIGIGYVTLPSLLEIIRIKSNIVLVRNNKRRQYKFAQLDILVDINKRYK